MDELERKKLLTTWAEKTKIDLDKLEELFNTSKERVKGYFPQFANNEDALDERAFQIMRSEISTYVNDKSEKVYGYFFAKSDVVDFNQLAIDKIMNQYNEAKVVDAKTGDNIMVQQMIDNGIIKIDENGRVVPLEPATKYGRTNMLAGKPIRADPQCTLLGFGIKENDTEVKPISFILNGDRVNMEFPLNTLVEVNGKVSVAKDESKFYVRSTKTSKAVESTHELFSKYLASKPDISDLIKYYYGEFFLGWDMIERIIERLNTNQDVSLPDTYKNFCIIDSSILSRINMQPNAWGSLSVELTSAGMDSFFSKVMGFLPASLSNLVTFGPGTKILVVGKPTPKLPTDQFEASIRLNITGIVPYKDSIIPLPNLEPITEENLDATVPSIPSKAESIAPQNTKIEPEVINVDDSMF